MAVTVRTLKDEEQRAAESLAAGKYLVTERLCRTTGGQLVSEDRCVDGGHLAYTPGMEIPLAEARANGLIPEVALTPSLTATATSTPIVIANETSAVGAAPRGKRR